ncbi:MAG: ABC transporter permease [Opitutae bacterium]
MIPLSHCFRNLLRRPGQSCQLVLGSSVVVLLIMTAASMNHAMEQTLGNTGDPLNTIFLGAGSEESVERSEVKQGVAEIIASSTSGIRQIMGKASVSPEIHFNGMLSTLDGKISQAFLRGVQAEALWVHQEVRILEGRFPNPGEIMVGRLAHQKLGLSLSKLQLGQILFFNGEKLVISGIFDAIGTILESEIWIPLQDLMTYTQRDNLSCVVVALNNRRNFGDLDAFAKRRLDLELVAIQETEYYGKLSSFYAPIRWMAWICAILLSFGALFGGLNALYAAFSSRIREFGAIQAIGFNRWKILLSLVEESSITGFIGSLLAFGLVGAILQDLAVPFSIGVFVLDFNRSILGLGMATGLFLGIFGGLPPAWKCLSPSLPETLRSA